MQLDILSQAPTISPVSTLGNLVELAAGGVLTVGALAVLMYLILGGFNWVTAGGDKSKVETAKSMITQAIIGLAILASVFAIYGVLLTFFGLGDRINLGSGGGGGNGTPTTSGNPTSNTCPGGYAIGSVAEAGTSGNYCVWPTGGVAPGRVRCVAAGQGPSGYNYPHFEPCSCASGASARAGVQFHAPACPAQ